MTGIYKITNLDNGKMYVGQAVDINRRWKDHKRLLNKNQHGNSHLQSSWNKHGENKFDFSIIELCNENELDEKEIYWIDRLRTYHGFVDCNGYNNTLGGQGTSCIHVVLQFDLSGNLIKEWNNVPQAARELNIDPSAIYLCVHKKIKRVDKYIFCFLEDYHGFDSLQWYFDERKVAPVLQCDLSGNILKKWETCKIARLELGYNPIRSRTNGTLVSHGYIYIYEDDYYILTDEYLEYINNVHNRMKAKRVVQLDENGAIVKMYDSMHDVTRSGFHIRMVRECCQRKRNTVKGFVFCYEEDLDYFTPEKCYELCNTIRKRYRGKILQLDLDGVLIKTYNRLSDVVVDGFNMSNISDCCKGIIDSYKGYKWSYDKKDGIL